MSGQTTADVDPSTDAVTRAAEPQSSADGTLRWGAYLIAISGIGFVANGVAMLYRVFYSTGFEAGVDALGGVTRAELASTNPELLHYVDHLHVNVAGLMVAAGLGVIALAWFGVRRGRRWALATSIAVPLVFLAHSLPIHRTAHFSFDALVHLGPGALWLPALVAGAILSYHGLRSVDSGPASAEGRDR